MRHVLTGARIFDGTRLLADHALVIEDGRITGLPPSAEAPPATRRVAGILAPGFVDLQVNGGAGLMVGGDTDPDALRRICAAHRALGCAGILPTLITDRAEVTARVIAAGVKAAQAGVPGFLGLHLEGPHLDPRRAGAHDPALIRRMEGADLARLIAAARALPVLMVTLAPEAATPAQIAALTQAGVIVSLGHSDCSFDAARASFAAGAQAATHLFNAMSQMGHRAPGLVGAVLSGQAFAGLIADGIHVHPEALRIALAARPEGLFLVSDCMAFAGTDRTRMTLQGRVVQREGGRLTLPDGTLAGADLRLDRALRLLVNDLGVPVARALAMATRVPAALARIGDRVGALEAGRAAEVILLSDDLTLAGVWQDGDLHPVPPEGPPAERIPAPAP
ncbi:N-acetylglucosamine-6-phosphate deacetylase [Paracoccus gahaiensis]|uniref:N-acetylglucosamine-6-phosphate deacetylase n=1 Tax=Paracoccus gahaiensis TaxID=1706839 RepID=A0A4U0RAV7_9RHOB|nr:N-acetylglucosamine-6-phosphate deacetylase [Paracoccus gahaiensis]TJZ92006.1 N-acetylglucosamine-6-phosphate deacetylase [Paracoccus gahaiensis]